MGLLNGEPHRERRPPVHLRSRRRSSCHVGPNEHEHPDPNTHAHTDPHTDADVHAHTNTPTYTPTPTATPVDIDGDGFLNPFPPGHPGPANTNTNYDNCPDVYNPDQINSDGNFISLQGIYVFDDLTRANSGAGGDACDVDDDNDWLSDAAEAQDPVCPSASGPTNPLLADTDGDLVIDASECNLGSDPLDPASKPAVPPAAEDADHDTLSDAFEISIGTDPNNPDIDGDGLKDGIEYKYYGTRLSLVDTDGDGVRDGCEAASLNGDNVVNVGDQSVLSAEINRAPPPAKLVDFDINKDGTIGPGDQALQSSFTVAGACP